MDLKSELLFERLATYRRLRGGYPIPLAGAVYWLALSACGYTGMRIGTWNIIACWSSGAIFPLALLFAKLARVDFMHDRSAVKDVIPPAFISMLLFWPLAAAAVWKAPTLFPLIFAIGMSQHWPVIGWYYGKTLLYSTHAVARALTCFAIWIWLPESRLTLLPLAVTFAYLATVAAILLDTRAHEPLKEATT